MNRRARITRPRGVGRWIVQGVLGAGLLTLAALLGCTSLQPRLQSDDEGERYPIETLRDKATVGNAMPIKVGGVGLVVGLEGTGGDCPPSSYRSILENELRKENVHNIRQLMSSPENAMVYVNGVIPPGASKGDTIDLEVLLPHDSRATSLRGGYLHKCFLFNYDFAERLAPSSDPNGPHGLLRGQQMVEAEGTLLVGVGGNGDDETASVKRGRIWGGGRLLSSQAFSLILNQQSARVADLVANRVNESFQAGFHGDPGTAVAVAKTPYLIALRVPPQYRLNTPRYLRVVLDIPFLIDPRVLDMPINDKSEDHRSYRQRLADDLLDPARTVVAALRLEALGQRSIPALKQGLKSEHPLVRFCSAEALAYLGESEGGNELAAAVDRSPLLRSFALTAMASLDEAVCHVRLTELLTSGREDETRYGAFRALHTLNPHQKLVHGELLNDSFWLHRVAPHSTSLVHISSTRRAEIVVFGEEPMLKPSFGLQAGEFVVTATKDDHRCTISRVPLRGRPKRRFSSLELTKVLQTLADMGCMYPEAIALLQQANTGGILSCRLRCDALPQAVQVEELALLGQTKLDPREAEAELIPAGQDLGPTPTLFDNPLATQTARVRQRQRMLAKDKQQQQQHGDAMPE
ncbi:MAG TPA: flagellar basal body P-ring protein FlgI [Gemmataceae bacterium]|nr:flagellar basal body P-ring protein FlgI [Gemmataceae bacterium]